MKRFGQLHLMHPFKGARILRDQLHEQGIMIGSKHVKTLMTRMGIKTVDCKPNTSNKTNAAR
jgi:putative transposase